jgi:hypothetical protein
VGAENGACYDVDPSVEGGRFKGCTLTIDVEEDMEPPVYVYYQLDNFYQNHRRYVKSRSDKQLRGEEVTAADLSDCDPLDKQGDKILNPCGLIANSMFNGNDLFLLLSAYYPLAVLISIPVSSRQTPSL